MRTRVVLFLAVVSLAACRAAKSTTDALPPAPAGLPQKLAGYREAASKYPQHPWRDAAPLNADSTVNGYVEISKGDSSKWEFRIPLNRREVDRTIPQELGGYPINYGFLPQTVSYDGDPADVLVTGPPIEGGAIVRGRIVGFMRMMDTGDLDSKVIISPLNERGDVMHPLEASDRQRLEQFFDNYKKHDGKVTKITGWGDEAEARAFMEQTSRFFKVGK